MESEIYMSVWFLCLRYSSQRKAQSIYLCIIFDYFRPLIRIRLYCIWVWYVTNRRFIKLLILNMKVHRTWDDESFNSMLSLCCLVYSPNLHPVATKRTWDHLNSFDYQHQDLLALVVKLPADIPLRRVPETILSK